MNRVHVIGSANCGKTRLIVDIVKELRLRGLRVGTIRHTTNLHVLDRPGSDSYRHRAAGAEPAAILTPDASAVYRRSSRLDAYSTLESEFAECDVVLVEGDVEAHAPKVEIWSVDCGEPPLAASAEDVEAVVADAPSRAMDLVEDRVAVVSRSNVPAIADVVMALAGLRRGR